MAERAPDDLQPAPDVRRWRTPGFPVDAERILRLQGYRDPSRIRPRIRTIAERAAAAVTSFAEPQAAYVRLRVEGLSGGVLDLEGGHRFRCAAFDRLLANAPAVVVFVLTLGPRVEAETAARFAEEPVDALFLESAGWLVVERATRLLARHVSDELAAEGLGVLYRLGPGYDYKAGEERAPWGLEEQPALFAAFGGADLPVELLESCAMTPKLSRSGLFGLAARP